MNSEQTMWLFKCILNREPNSQEIDWAIENYSSFEVARHALIMSPEFQDHWFPAPKYQAESSKQLLFRNPDQKLVVSSIVKNEANRIRSMLLSCAPIADHFVILDTGSDDDTTTIATQCLIDIKIPFTLSSTKFENFSQARNAALDLTPPTMKWVLMMDADEHLVEEDYQKLLDLLDQSHRGWRLPRYNFSDAEKKERPSPYPDYQARLFRYDHNTPVRYQGTVHEYPIGIESWRAAPTSDAQHNGPVGGPHIHHMGHVTTSPEKVRIKQELYNKLLSNDILSPGSV